MIRSNEEASRLLEELSGRHLDSLAFTKREDESGPDARIQKVFHWETEDERRLEVDTDANTGQVVGIWIPRADNRITVSQQEAFKEAVRFLETYVDPGVEEIQVSQIIEPAEANPVSSGDWQFEFIKSHEGVPVLEQDTDEAYIVTVDPSTGKANGFVNKTQHREEVTLPEKSGAVPVEQAAQAYLAHMPLQLAYTIKGVEGEELVEPKLIYIPMGDEDIRIDAITGQAISP